MDKIDGESIYSGNVTARPCKDCKHHNGGFFGAMCSSPQQGIEPINGQRITSSCSHQRDHFKRYCLGYKICGPHGDWFKPKA